VRNVTLVQSLLAGVQAGLQPVASPAGRVHHAPGQSPGM